MRKIMITIIIAILIILASLFLIEKAKSARHYIDGCKKAGGVVLADDRCYRYDFNGGLIDLDEKARSF